MSEYTPKELMAAYMGLRSKKEAAQKELKAWVADIDTQLDKIEMYLFDVLTEMNSDSIKADGNTAFKTSKDYLNISDKQEFSEFVVSEILKAVGVDEGHEELVKQVLDSGALDLMTIKAAKTECKQYLDANGESPPGTKYTQETVIQVRKA